MEQAKIKLLLDEHIWVDLAVVLQQRGFDAIHVNSIGRSLDDEFILKFAAQESRAVLTNNFKDFAKLAEDWFAAGHEHAGIVFTLQLTPSELIRQCDRMLRVLSSDDVKNNIRWLQEFS